VHDEENLTNRQPAGNLLQVDFSPLSVGALRDYISALQAEIARAEAAIVQKEVARGHADSFFKRT